MTRGLYKELIEVRDEAGRLRKALKNSALHALYQGHRADDAEAELSEQNETIGRLRAERDALREAIKEAIQADLARQHGASVSVVDVLSKALEGGG